MRFLICVMIFFGLTFWGACNDKENNGYQLKWDFSVKKDLIYSYKETIYSDIAGHPNNSYTGKSKMIIDGKLVVAVNDNKCADIYLKDFLMWKYFLDEDENIVDTLSDYKTVQHLSIINEFSEIDSSKAKNPLFGYIFLLPNKTMRKGDTENILVGYSNTNQNTYTKGGVRFIFKDIKSSGNGKIATFENEIDVSEVHIPGTGSGNYNAPTRGSSSYNFDLKEGYFISGSIYFGINWSVDTIKTISSHDVNFELIEIRQGGETIEIKGKMKI